VADIVIPEAQHKETAPFEIVITRSIMLDFAVNMLGAIELNDETSFETNEIDRVGADGRLSAELVAVELPSTQSRPKLAFDVRRIATELTGEEDRV
jgi:hypothetical protein